MQHLYQKACTNSCALRLSGLVGTEELLKRFVEILSEAIDAYDARHAKKKYVFAFQDTAWERKDRRVTRVTLAHATPIVPSMIYCK